MSGYVVGSAEGTRSLTPEDRGCLFVEEGGLVHYSKYSYSSCKFECLTETARLVVGCVPWYIPHGGSTRVCQPWEALNFTETLAGLSAGDCKRCLSHNFHKHKKKISDISSGAASRIAQQ